MGYHLKRFDFRFGTFGDDHILGGAFNDFIFSFGGDDEIDAGDGNDIVFAGRGDDRIIGGLGSDYSNGGRGFDTAVYDGSVLDYDISISGPRWFGPRVTVTQGDDVDTLRRVEALEFDDFTLFLDGRNNAVFAQDDAASVDEDAILILGATDLLANDIDFDGDALSILSVDAVSASGAAITFVDGEITYDQGGLFDTLGTGETATDSFTYIVDDGLGGAAEATVTITINGVNDAPEIDAPADVEFAENGTGVVTIIVAVDPDSVDISFSITGGVDAALFDIDALSGALIFRDAPDFETALDADGDNTYIVEVSATDDEGAADSATVAVTVTDVDEIPPVTARINEIHYDNAGTDIGEFIEIRTAAGDDVRAVTVDLYNGSNGMRYASDLSLGAIVSSDGTFDYYVIDFPSNGIQNGAPDGVALSNGGVLIEFLSYEGEFDGVGGPADGVASTNIGQSENGGTPPGFSLQRNDEGGWDAARAETKGAANVAVIPLDARINEFHYDNAGGDQGEFIEIRVNAGADISGLVVELYNGNGGAVYSTPSLPAEATGSDGAFEYYVIDLPANGLQNGSPDGIALSNDGTLIEFLSYEGDFTGVGGAADGVLSTNIIASEPGDTAIGSSLQRSDDGATWTLTDGVNTSGAANEVPLNFEARINEFHYDNAGTDAGEFIEIRVTAGADVSGLTVELYNGNGGAVYSTLTLPAAPAGSDDSFSYYVIDLPANGIQNGPDGIALSNNGALIEFLSYEDVFTGVGGAADGVLSTDIGQAEGGATAVGDSLQRGDGDVWNAPAAETKGAANNGDTGGGGDPTALTISQVQGAGAASTRVNELVSITAIVTGDFQTGDADALRDLGGFFLQEEGADQDADTQTSEGIFIFEGDTLLTDVSVGDRVTVVGVVGEAFGATQITATSVTIDEAGAIADINTQAQTVNLDETEDLEAVEGMLVTFEDTLTINEMFHLDRFNEIRLTAGERPQQFTQFNEPNNDAANGQTYQEYLDEIGSDQIVFDDGLSVQNAPIFPEADLNGDGVFDTADGFTMGDQITGLTGVIDFSFGEYRVRSVENDANTFVDVETREDAPPEVGGDIVVASFNVLNFFTTLDVDGNPGSGPNNLDPRGADSHAEYDRQLEKLVTTLTLMDADVFGLVELENEFGGDQNGDGVYALEELVTALNAAIGAPTYAFVDPGRAFVDTGDAISVGMIYKPSVVSVNIGSVEILDDSDLDGLGFGALDDDGVGVFDGASTNRAPLAATFTEIETGEDFTVAVTHMKSKGGTGTGGNADQNDGAGNFNEIRTEGVEVLTAWLDQIGDTDTVDGETVDGDILVVGDFNAYAREDPIDAMIAAGYTNLEEGGADTFVFDGQTGTLDYAFANASLAENVTGAEAWRINSDEPDAIDYNLDFGRDAAIFDGGVPFRTSDHDPVLIGLDLDQDILLS